MAILPDEEQKHFKPTVLNVESRHQFRFTFCKIKGKAIAFSEASREKNKSSNGLIKNTPIRQENNLNDVS